MSHDTELDRLRRWSDAVTEITRMVNSDSGAGLLDLIAARTAELTGYDFCSVQLHDAEHQSLLIAGSFGLDPRYVEHVNTDRPIRLRAGDDFYDSPSSRAFRERRTIEVASVADTVFAPWRPIAEEQGYRSMLAVPMVVEGEVVGVLTCYSRRPGEHAPTERDVAELMAGQAAVAIHTARLRRRERQALARLEESNHALQRHQKVLERADRMHRQLMRVVLADQGLEDVVQALARVLRAPVTIEDSSGAELVHADFLSSRARPLPPVADPAVAAALEAVQSRKQVTVVRPEESDGPAGDDFWVGPVVIGSEVVARLWVRAPSQGLGPLERRAVERGCLVVAMEMLKRRTALEVELRLSRDVLTDLLLGEGAHRPADLLALAGNLGHDLSVPHRVLVASLDGGRGAPRDPEVAGRRMVSAALRAADGIRPKPLVGLRQDTGIMLLPTASTSVRGPGEVAGRWRAELERLSSESRATVILGESCADLADYPAAFAVARGALRLATRGGPVGRVVDLAEFGIYTVLLRSSDPEPLLEFASAKLAPVRAHDERRGTDLLRTLRAYLEHGGRTSEVGAELMVHANTVLNRVARLENLLDVDLADPRARLEIQLALMVADVADATGVANHSPRA
ncbi:helix-turn-helix domain-containing protein [Streptomyces sparsogenes]|uniref:helix-turn-helix domain-containing protein n=1 Tax=Streptomyces sparsogenes TaxID=67365 RepID=UPI0033FBE35B